MASDQPAGDGSVAPDTLHYVRHLAAICAVVLVLLPSTALGQSVGDIADAVDRRGYFVEEGTVAVNSIEGLVLDYPALGFVALVGDVDDADFLAEDVLDGVGSRDTVVVLTASQVGVASVTFDNASIDRALERAFGTTGDSYEVDFREFAEALTGGSGSESQQSSGGGFSVWWLVTAGVVVIGFVMWRNSRRDQDTVERRFQQAKQEVESQMAVIANQIIELSDRVDLAEDEAIEGHFRRGSETFREAEQRLAAAVREGELEELSDDLDRARWEFAAAAALLDGEEPPPEPAEDEPAPKPCFFDPTHGAGVESAVLETPAGQRRVLVCRADADKLRRGERPQPREIQVGRRRVPAPQAPRSHGGGGINWLDVFSVVVGGMGEATRYKWNPRGRRGTGGPFGGMGGGFPSRTRPSNRSRSTPRPSRRTKGRGRRSR